MSVGTVIYLPYLKTVDAGFIGTTFEEILENQCNFHENVMYADFVVAFAGLYAYDNNSIYAYGDNYCNYINRIYFNEKDQWEFLKVQDLIMMNREVDRWSAAGEFIYPSYYEDVNDNAIKLRLYSLDEERIPYPYTSCITYKGVFSGPIVVFTILLN